MVYNPYITSILIFFDILFYITTFEKLVFQVAKHIVFLPKKKLVYKKLA